MNKAERIRVIIWGTGVNAERVEKSLTEQVIITAYIDDRSEEKEYHNCKIIRHEQLREMEYDYIIISSYGSYNYMHSVLVRQNVEDCRIVCLWYEKSAEVESVIFNSNIRQLYIENNRFQIENDRYVRKLANYKYEHHKEVLDENLFIPDMYTIDETIDYICTHKVSVSRYGDGEFEIMAEQERPAFQKVNVQLAKRLREVVQSNDEGMVICISNIYGSLEDITEQGADEIRNYLTEEVRHRHEQMLPKGKKWYDTHFTRLYAIMKEKDKCKERFEKLQTLWKNQNVTIIEGAATRFGCGNDLLKEANSVRRILAPAENAYDCYEQILETAKKEDKQQLILIALGPTATVLAYDLHMAGYWAIDIGHLDMEYEWYLRQQGNRTEVRYKYNNEYPGGNCVEEYEDAVYLQQIVERIGK